MTPIGQIERKTQDRVVALLQGRLGYADLGNRAQQAKAAKAGDDDGDAVGAARAGSKEKASPARSAAFVELVHAVVNSNEFLYRL